MADCPEPSALRHDAAAARLARAAAALRENLRKRKQQARARDAAGSTPQPEEDAASCR